MANTSKVDLVGLIEMAARVRLGKAYGTGEKRTRKGSCPFCGGTDRFAVFVNAMPQRYYCGIHGGSGCGAHGDAITFLREYEGLSYFEACEKLDVDPGNEYVRREHAGADGSLHTFPPEKKWQERAHAVVHLAQRVLWGPVGKQALDYLHARGLSDETIKAAQLGYIPVGPDGRWIATEREIWGLPPTKEGEKPIVWLPEGIAIPWCEGETLWKLTVRRLSGWKKGEPKYCEITGSKEGLYNGEAIQIVRPVVLCESELDALSGAQQCGDLAAFVATGSVGRARTMQWKTRLCLASHVLVAFDDDEEGRNGKRAGDEAAAYWLGALPHATRWLPWGHDLNDMVCDGQDIRAWLQLGLASAELERCAVVEGVEEVEEVGGVQEVPAAWEMLGVMEEGPYEPACRGLIP